MPYRQRWIELCIRALKQKLASIKFSWITLVFSSSTMKQMSNIILGGKVQASHSFDSVNALTLIMQFDEGKTIKTISKRQTSTKFM